MFVNWKDNFKIFLISKDTYALRKARLRLDVYEVRHSRSDNLRTYYVRALAPLNTNLWKATKALENKIPLILYPCSRSKMHRNGFDYNLLYIGKRKEESEGKWSVTVGLAVSFPSVLSGVSSWWTHQRAEGLWTLHRVPWALRLALPGLHGHVTAGTTLVLHRVVLWEEEVEPHRTHTHTHVMPSQGPLSQKFTWH